MTRYFEVDPDCKNCIEQKAEIGTEVIVPTYKIRPQYVDDAKWNKKRIEIRNDFFR